MELVLIAVGGVLIALAFVDALATTVSVGSQGGWLTQRLTRLVWRVLLWTSRTGTLPGLLRPAGVLMLTTTLLTWVGLLWAGVSLVLLAGDPAVIDADTRAAANPLEVVYFAGFTVFTLGVGDYAATNDAWRLFTASMSFAGLALVTLGITYLLSVVQAVVHRRSVAVHIHALGRTPDQVVAGGWDGSQFSSAFEQHLVSLTPEVAKLSEQHLAYPVLHYFSSGNRATSAPVAIAVLDDALLLLEHAVADGARPPASGTAPLRYALERHMTATQGAAGEDPSLGPPPEPALTALVTAGVPLADQDGYRSALQRVADRRARMHRMVRARGWEWATT